MREAASAARSRPSSDACRGGGAEHGALDLWVNNAGVLTTGLPWERDQATQEPMLSVNAVGAMNGTLAALGQMVPAGRGQVITTADPDRVAREVGKLTERPRTIVVIPRWRGPLLRLFDVFPGFDLRLLPLVMWMGKQNQKRYKRLVETDSGPDDPRGRLARAQGAE